MAGNHQELAVCGIACVAIGCFASECLGANALMSFRARKYRHLLCVPEVFAHILRTSQLAA